MKRQTVTRLLAVTLSASLLLPYTAQAAVDDQTAAEQAILEQEESEQEAGQETAADTPKIPEGDENIQAEDPALSDGTDAQEAGNSGEEQQNIRDDQEQPDGTSGKEAAGDQPKEALGSQETENRQDARSQADLETPSQPAQVTPKAQEGETDTGVSETAKDAGEDEAQEDTETPEAEEEADTLGNWVRSGSRWWYQYRDGSYPRSQWEDIDGSRYYFGEDGVLVTGLTEIEGQTYQFGTDGAMFTGWEITDSGRRYFLADGPMALGWQSVEGQTCYFGEDGFLVSGWVNRGEYRCYLYPEGGCAIGPAQIDGETHYFSPGGLEVILVNALNPVPDYFKRDLVNVVDYHDVDRRCYDALVQMLDDCTAAGIEYDFNSAYRTVEEQAQILAQRTQEYMDYYEWEEEKAREKALETVALPGTSEHNLGLAVDLLGSQAVAWFQEHCWDYGFIVRYAADKQDYTGITNEPWHFRYVGKEVALELKDSGLCLEEYLGAPPAG